MASPAVQCSLQHLTPPACSSPLFTRSSLSDEEVYLIRIRGGIPRLDAICYAHKKKFLELYSSKQRLCVDPLKPKAHNKVVSKDLKEVTIEWA